MTDDYYRLCDQLNREARRWTIALAVTTAVALLAVFCFGCASVQPPEETPTDPVEPPSVVVESNDVVQATGEVRRLALCFGWTAVDPLAADWAGWTGECPGCDNDANAMSARLTRWGYSPRVILNEKAKWEDVQVAVAIAGSHMRAGAGDWIWICSSGHGGWIDDDNGDEPSGKDSTVCTWDRNVRDDCIKRMLVSSIPAGSYCVLFNDQCHSEGNWRSFARTVQKAVSFGRWGKVQPRPLIEKTDDLPFALIQLAGCRENNYSYSAQSEDGTWHGTWTQTFLGNARDDDGLRMAFERAKEEMPPSQMPVWVEGGNVTEAFRDAPLSAIAPKASAPMSPTIRAEWTPERRPKTAILTWNHPYDNTDGTTLTNLATYRVYERDDNGGVTRLREVPADYAAPSPLHPPQSTVFTNITGPKIVLGLTAVNSLGDESAMSPWVTNKYSIPNLPRNVR